MRGLLLLPLLLGVAHATPVTLNHQVRLLNSDGVPLNGDFDVTVSLWTASSGGTQLWTDDATLPFERGYSTVVLATNDGGQAVQGEWFANEVWVEIAIDNTVLGGRMQAVDVPRAATVASAMGQTVSIPGATFELNVYPTTWAATPDKYTGNISVTLDGTTYIGRVATTAICQDLMGPGARLCRASDIERFITAGAVNAHGESDSNKLTYPTLSSGESYFTVSSGGATDIYNNSTTAHMYSDCDHYTYSSSNRRITVAYPANSAEPYGATKTTGCNQSQQLLCCQ